MIKTFTQNDIVRYVYHETTEQENEEIAQALLCDDQLLETYHELSFVSSNLNDVTKEPSERAIENIMAYVRSYEYHSAND